MHVGPKRFEGRTVVRHVDRPGTLELEAEGGPWGTARIAFDIRPWGERTLVIVDEHPLRGLGGTLHNPLLDSLLQLRPRVRSRRILAPPTLQAADRNLHHGASTGDGARRCERRGLRWPPLRGTTSGRDGSRRTC
ncbi:hypothetical protein [Streptomyces sp. bgisy029]|uniref:hypothetical protein n=1 Tax=Streptomyces sp. bgisy029 TaxID=3413771 RepID=UPI003D76482D